jgi:LCP family protein required for cell wall assembly
MAKAEKPYRVYRGGRVKGKVPVDRPGRRDGSSNGRAPRKLRPARRPWSRSRRIALVLVLLLVLIVVWAVTSYLAFSGGVEKANARLKPSARAALAPQSGLLLSHPTTILLLGTDHKNTDERVDLFHSDSITLVHTDPSKHRLSYLQIPRDLRVSIPGFGLNKVNAAFQFGKEPLAIRTIQTLGLPVYHVVVVDFSAFQQLIDAIGGVDIDVPEPIVSHFECPYDAQRCATWKGWRFAKGRQHMDGRRALIYSRVRKNALNPGDNDITRGARQQAVIQAIQDKVLGFGNLAKLPFDGGDLVRPIETDLSAWQLVQLAWLKKRAGRVLHCRLGGTASGSDIVGDEQNRVVIQEFLGEAAPQPNAPGSGPFGPGCVVGSQKFRT